MATVESIVTRALKRIRVASPDETPTATEASDALAALNAMLLRWPSQGVDAKHAAMVLTDEFYFFVPPAAATSEVIDALSYRGTWNASSNTPTLTSGSGTKGYYYRVSTAGSTTLDDVTSWSANDFAVFNGTDWLKSVNASRFDQAVIDMLALELCQDFGKEPSAMLDRAARNGWTQVQAAYIKAPTAIVDRQVMQTMQRAFVEEEIIQ